jgi:hypothetical protein
MGLLIDVFLPTPNVSSPPWNSIIETRTAQAQPPGCRMQFKCDVTGGQQMTCTVTEKDVSCSWEMTFKCGEQGADPWAQ